ncbi:T9SS type A sorting domain-containing protein [Flavobacterium orientale]|nr:T9SS type A sorting domain-containing protein [Flavobacterium orientale]
MKQKRQFQNELRHVIPIKNWLTTNSRFQSAFLTMKTICTTLIVVITLMATHETKAQIVSGAALKANFGIDADVYANRLQFGNLAGPIGTDDWFANPSLWPGSGLGVIDVTNAAGIKASILANNNFSFEKRMSVPYNTILGTNIWIDAVYARDNNSSQGNSDATSFSGNSNKNGDDPTTWSLGSGGSPPKNDLIDVFGYLRRDISPAALAQSPTGILWGFGGATTVSADGNSHTDFEFFRREVTYNGNALVNAGPNAGHTAWVFEPDGSIDIPGDILVAVDFANGGANPQASVRIWMSSADIANFNSRPNRPFSLTGTFDQGNGSGVFGYAGITTKDPTAEATVFAVVNVTAPTLGAPWGSQEGNAAYFDDMKALQFAEFGINLTALGLDSRSNDDGPCNNLLGSLLVKTRSSASFTAELKDFSGPFLFGNITDVDVTANASNEVTCTNPTATLTATNVTPPGASIKWYGPSPGPGQLGPELVGNAPVVSNPGVYTVRASAGPVGCFAEDTVTVTENKTPPNANAGADKELTCTVTSIALSGASTTPGATFAWVASNGGNIVSGANTATPTVNAAGTYTLTVTNPANGCTATDVALVTLDNTPPNANAGADKELTCTVTSIALSGASTTPGATFAWIASNGGNIVSGANTATPTVNAAGTYTLTVTNPANGCTATDVALVTMNNTPPNANAGADKELTCTVTSIALSGSSTTPGATFAWVASDGGNIVSGANTATPTVNAAGTYTLTVTNPANGCTTTDIALVTLNNTPPNANAGADKELTCTVTSIALSGASTTPGATFAWVASNGGNIVSGANTATPTVNAAGTYTLTVTNPANGCTATDIALVTLNNTPPNANAGADKELTCIVTSIALSGSSTTPGATFAWIASNGGNIVSGANTATPTVNAAGTYTLTVTNPANGCTATDVALVTFDGNLPNANAGADKELTCTVTSIALSGSSTTPGATFAWVASNGGNIVSGANTATPTVNAAGTYTLTVTNPANGCTATDVALVTLDNTPPNANAGADKELTCTVTSIALSGSSTTPGATFAWVASNGGNIVSGANTATPTVNAAGTYTLTVTNPANGCTATDVALVTLNNTPPNANAGADKELTCTVTSIALSGSSTTPGATFAWVASNGGNIVSGANTATPTVNAAGTYTLTVTNPANGCTATDIALVTLNNTPPNANAGADKELTCIVTSIALSGSSTTPGATFAWIASNGGNIVSGANTATPTVNAAGTYTLTVTNPANGCTATDVALVTLDGNLPNANAGADKELTCTVTSIALSGSSTTPGATFAWVASNGGNIVSGANTATPTVNGAGTYTLTVTNPANGCTATDVALVTLDNTPPNANAGADKELTCTVASIALSGSSTTPGATFAWIASNGGNIVSGANTATPTVNAAGTYTLTVTNPANGCTATDVALVTINNTPPNANAGADKELTCTVTSIALSGSSTTPGATFAWVASNGGNIVSGANTATPTVNAAGTYTLTVTNPANGCTATDVALVTLNNTPPNANAGADKELNCTSKSVSLSGSSTTPGATFAWVASNGGNIAFGADTATPTVDAAGTYTLTVTNPDNGCTATDVALVTLNNTPPNANAGDDAQISCDTSTVQLSGSSTTVNVSFSWSTLDGNIVSGADTATPTVDMEGTYVLTVTDLSNGCTTQDEVVVTRPECEFFDGCTIGYWKNHPGSWCGNYSPGTKYGTVFTSAPNNIKNKTFMEVLNLGGGGPANLGRQSVAALLNICHAFVNYGEPYLNNTQLLITTVNNAFASNGNATGNLATALDDLNNAGCSIDAHNNPIDPIQFRTEATIGRDLFDIYPVPFQEEISIKYNFDYKSKVTIEIFDYRGILVYKYQDSNGYTNKEESINMHFARNEGQLFMVRVTTDKESTTKTIIKARK